MKAYRDEDQVASDSMTETFVAGKLAVENMDFAGVPIYIRTGKRMKEKATRIDVVFKQMPVVVFKDSCLKSDVLTINVDPEPGISIQLNTKRSDKTLILNRLTSGTVSAMSKKRRCLKPMNA